MRSLPVPSPAGWGGGLYLLVDSEGHADGHKGEPDPKHRTRSRTADWLLLMGGRGLSPVDEVDGSVNGIDDPGGAVRQLEALTCSYRLLPYEPKEQRDTC